MHDDLPVQMAMHVVQIDALACSLPSNCNRTEYAMHCVSHRQGNLGALAMPAFAIVGYMNCIQMY